MNRKEEILIANILIFASDMMSDNVSNDVPNDLWKDWSEDEKDELVKEYEDWNSKGRDYVKGYNTVLGHDTVVMVIFARKLLNNQKLSWKERKIISRILKVAEEDFYYRNRLRTVPIKFLKDWNNEELKEIENLNILTLMLHYSNKIINRQEKIKDITD